MKKEMTITEFATMGGIARGKKLSPERKSEIAKQAALARWKNKSKKMLASKIAA